MNSETVKYNYNIYQIRSSKRLEVYNENYNKVNYTSFVQDYLLGQAPYSTATVFYLYLFSLRRYLMINEMNMIIEIQLAIVIFILM